MKIITKVHQQNKILRLIDLELPIDFGGYYEYDLTRVIQLFLVGISVNLKELDGSFKGLQVPLYPQGGASVLRMSVQCPVTDSERFMSSQLLTVDSQCRVAIELKK